MRYTKQSKTIDEQADLLIKRGLICNSKNDLVDTLRDISYYRLSYFLYPYRKNDGTDDFKENVSLTRIIDRGLAYLTITRYCDKISEAYEKQVYLSLPHYRKIIQRDSQVFRA